MMVETERVGVLAELPFSCDHACASYIAGRGEAEKNHVRVNLDRPLVGLTASRITLSLVANRPTYDVT